MNGRNRYWCDLCRKSITTEDRDEGTTPFMIDCHATTACVGTMRSQCYRGADDDQPVQFIWRKPTPEEYLKAHRAMKEHFDMGGLDLYLAPPGSASGEQSLGEKP